MRRFFILTAIFTTSAVSICAQQSIQTDYYTFPVKGVAGQYAGNLGEIRSGHFHSGADIKTSGEGKTVVAAAEGYVSRIFVSPYGYGRALYITHPNGTISVYGHLSRFTEKIELYVREEHYRTQQNRLDIQCSADMFPVARGEEIALSGNTGQSAGPHLHFEIRDAGTNKTLNLLASSLIKAKDNIPPQMIRLYYIETDTVRGIPIHSAPRSYDLENQGGKKYSVKGGEKVRAGRNGYFVIETTDRHNGIQNRFGIYRASMDVNGQRIFEYQMDGFTFPQSRYCDAVSYYPLQRISNNETIRLACIEGNLTCFYPILVGRGALSVPQGATSHIRIEAEDDSGNISQLEFDAEGISDQECFRPKDTYSKLIAGYSRALVVNRDGATVTIPKDALYEPQFYEQSINISKSPSDPTIRMFSPVYSIMDCTTPLRSPITVSIKASIADSLRKHAALAKLEDSGKAVYVGGIYANGALTAKTRSAGDFFITADTEAPMITALFSQNADLSGKNGVSFSVRDNFSGIRSYSATIDGKWVMIDYNYIKGTFTHTFDDRTRPTDNWHNITLKATDRCGNTTVWSGVFFR